MRLKHPAVIIFIYAAVVCSNSLYAESARMTPIVKVVKEWSGAVVNISTERVLLLRTHPFWGQFGGMIGDPSTQQHMQTVGTIKAKSIGSGVIISKDGLILTNAHVVQMANKVFITMNNGKQAEAVIAAISPDNDLAILKITPTEDLRPARIASDAMIGETVIAVGDPLGLENSISAGIISGLDRDLNIGNMSPVFKGLIQTDASINQGSSGGALFNLDGELVGINLAVVQGANSIAFAIPYTKIKKVLKEYDEAKKAPVSVVNTIKIPVQ